MSPVSRKVRLNTTRPGAAAADGEAKDTICPVSLVAPGTWPISGRAWASTIVVLPEEGGGSSLNTMPAYRPPGWLPGRAWAVRFTLWLAPAAKVNEVGRALIDSPGEGAPVNSGVLPWKWSPVIWTWICSGAPELLM